MKHSLFIAFIIPFFIASCKKDNNNNNPKDPIGTGKLTLLKGDNQSGIFGELLADTIKLKITSKDPEDHFKITYALVQGNGMVENLGNYTFTFFLLDTARTINLLWRMGCDNNQQKIRFYVYTNEFSLGSTTNHAPSDSITISASAVKPNGWCRACGYGNVDIYTPKIITPDNTNLYLVNNGIFKSTDGGYNWYKVNGIPYSDEIVDAQFNSKGWLYALTRLHGVFYSKDLQQWTEINNGILDKRDPTGFFVEDTALFVSFYFDGPYRTTDNGGFWRKILVGGGSQRFYLFKRHPSGRMFLVDDWGSVKFSDNNGDNWSMPSGSSSYQIYDLAINSQGIVYIGASDATILEVDYSGGGTNSLHSYYQWNASSQHVNNITTTANDVYYLVNYNPVPGIYRKGNNWNRIDIGFNNKIDYYYLKSSGSFLVCSKPWLYFKD